MLTTHSPYKKILSSQRAFTIVELLIVIVVIAILAALTLVAYNGLNNRATQSAVKAGVKETTKRLELDKATRGTYALALADLTGSTNSNDAVAYQYSSTGDTFCVTGTLRNVAFYVSNTSSIPTDGVCPGHDAPVTGPITDPVVHTQTSSFSVTQPAGVSGVDVPIAINFTLQPTDYVFVLFNARNNTNITLRNGASNIPNIYSRSMGNSGYQTHIAFSASGLSGQPTLTANACWTASCPYNASNVSDINAAYVVYVMRGLGPTPTFASTFTPYGVQPGSGVAVPSAIQSINANDVAIYSYVFYGNNLPSETDLSSPARTWTTDSTAPPSHLGTAIATRHTFATATTNIQYQTTMAPSGTSYFGSVLFTFK